MRNFLYVLTLVSFFCRAQPGHYFLSHFAPADKKIDHAAFDMVQDANGFLYFATRAGILQFDGTNWNLIPTGGAVYAVEADNGNLYWCGSAGFGDLRSGANGAMEAHVHPGSSEGDFFSIAAGTDGIYFLGEHELAVLKGDSARILQAPEQAGAFTSVADVAGTIFVSSERMGILKPEDSGGFQPMRFGSILIPDILSSSAGSESLLATSDNRLYTCDKNLRVKQVLANEQDLLSAGSIVEARWVNERLIAIATLRAGVIFADPVSGQIREVLNYNTGLPDNEVYALYVDRGSNVWVAHDYGFTRIAPGVPFRDYSNYEGLEGNLLCVETFNDDVYVGTSLGLYRLTKEAIYEEITWYEPANTMQPEAFSEEPKRGRRGLFAFLRRRESKPSGTSQPVHEMQPRTARVLKSERFVYKRVNGIEAKVSGLTRANDRLLASGLGGVFEVQKGDACNILKVPVRFSFATADGHLVVSSYDNSLILLSRAADKWKHTDALDNADDLISQVFEHDGKLWLCGINRIYRTAIEDDGFSTLHAMRIDNPGFSRTIGFVLDNRPVFVNRNGFYVSDARTETLTKVDSLPEPYAYFASSSTAWYSDAHSWKSIGVRADRGINVLRLLNDIRAVSEIEASEDLWVINGNDVLYRISPQNMRGITPVFPLMLHSVTQGDRHFDPGRDIVAEQDGGPVVFQVVRPNYLGSASSEYRYLLSGISTGWSEWSVLNNQVNIPYLPPGPYTLQVQSRDILGEIHDMKPVRFAVRPLFWKSTWFYAMELALFALLGWLSLKLSLRYRLVSRVLALLTIILLIEFIQTLVGHSFSTSSPLADFLLQVVIAFLILPVESYLRRVMFRDGRKSKLLAVIDDLDRREKGRQKSASG